jgi:membrane associated rhomboid family serine protease
MSRYAPRPTAVHYSFGPGPITPAVKWLIIANVVMFLATLIYEPIILFLGLTPRIIVEHFWVWQLATYAFLHGGPIHILFNMLGVWMFGVELERLWGTRQFVKYYAITGIGAGLTVLAVGLILGASSETYRFPTIGASGALYGLLVAFAYYYPDRPLLMFFLFPIPAKYFVMIVGAMAFLSAPQSRVSEAAHLGGLVIGYLYLRAGRGGLTAELKYRWVKWKMNRMRRKFDVYSGGRSDWDRHVH